MRTINDNDMPRDAHHDLEGSVVILSTIYAVFLLGVIALNIGWI